MSALWFENGGGNGGRLARYAVSADPVKECFAERWWGSGREQDVRGAFYSKDEDGYLVMFVLAGGASYIRVNPGDWVTYSDDGGFMGAYADEKFKEIFHKVGG